MQLCLRFVSTACFIATMVLSAASADAEVTLKLQGSGGGLLLVTDNGVNDSDPTLGSVAYVGPFDVFTSVTATGVSKPVLGDAQTAAMAVSVVSSTGAVPGTLTVSVTDTDFPGPMTGDTTIVSAMGGTTSGHTTVQAHVDTLNAPFGTAGASVCTPGPQGPLTGAFDNTASVPCTLAGPFSITVVVAGSISAGAVQSVASDVHLNVPQEPIGCRFTGGGVDTDGNWDHTLEDGEMVRNGAGNLPKGVDRYQFGGQVGARTALQPLPSGEWQHHQQTGPSGTFSFHGGTSSAAPGTQIVDVRCSDPGWCEQARPAPAKQLDFDAIGTFSNLGNGKSAPKFLVANPNVIPEPSGKKTAPFTYHWFEVNIDDLGEPGSLNSGAPNSVACPGRGFGEKSAGPFPQPDGALLPYAPLANCDCPDFYRITIYKGVLSSEVKFLADGRIDPTSLDRTTVIYEVFGYIDGGNLQIHPPTGFDK